ncbi:HNH endonuclease [Burkholderia gladioli]|uniref:HNH endonuclease n=1 Tax=Burkholderia gladioli TaxID=28095 RepID=UPI000FDA4BBB|nr:HNH endonuclease signature motif containing protein [Burkholderia gladioli]MBU9323268.1 HNH endonuclease [Burkholderia gladioli]MBU9427312.1 HNH endonuclease [Burkholderia gladioli]MDN8064453.1 HNH endonuclease signature motif containing protein [Burkholderia gladioli]QPQ82940.1 hypothetical protein I6H08_16905 [Burkholderia gladioli]
MDELVTALTPARGAPVVELSDDDKAAFLDLYRLYDAHRGEPSLELKARNISAVAAQAVHDGYDATQAGSRLAHLRTRLQAGIPRCPFCGFAPVTSLDHHLPRSTYRALAVYARNLVPACGTCNQKKGASVGGQEDHQRFINAYFADLPAERFFVARCAMVGGALVTQFEVVQTPGLSDHVFRRLTYQFQRLELNARLQGETMDFLVSLETGLEDAYNTPEGALAVSHFLARSATSQERVNGLNHWKTALLHGLTGCIEFCDGGFRLGHSNPGA